MQKLQDLTVLYIILSNNEDSLRNFQTIVRFIKRELPCEIMAISIAEEDKTIPVNICKSYCINRVLKEVTTPYVIIWNDSFITYSSQILSAYYCLKEEGRILSFPYCENLLFIKQYETEKFSDSLDFYTLDVGNKVKTMQYGSRFRGGIYLVNRKEYLQTGGESTFFTSEYLSDYYRIKKMESLEKNILSVEGELFYLYHKDKKVTYIDIGDANKIEINELLKVI
ncbi:MAG: hypothetical protein LUH10_12245 [Tannerellaceae bacterium]|nr:hypothetical protein [Tannerellaceae bacterium]